MSILHFNSAFDIFVIVFINFVFPFSFIACCIFLYIVSRTNGTATNIDTLYSAKFFWICFNPSQNATVAPLYNPYKNVIVHSKVWCIGKNDSSVSVSYIFTHVAIADMFEHIFFCDNSTAFGIFVVPDVNNIIDGLFSFIFIFSYFLSPCFIAFFPSFKMLSYFFISSLLILSIHISSFNLLFSFFIFIMISANFLSKMTASAPLLFINDSISLSGNALSKGTTIMFPLVIAR